MNLNLYFVEIFNKRNPQVWNRPVNMAQGKFKSKGSLPKGVKGKQSHKQKNSGPKRGGDIYNN